MSAHRSTKRYYITKYFYILSDRNKTNYCSIFTLFNISDASLVLFDTNEKILSITMHTEVGSTVIDTLLWKVINKRRQYKHRSTDYLYNKK